MIRRTEVAGSVRTAWSGRIVVDSCRSTAEHEASPTDPTTGKQHRLAYLDELFEPFLDKRGKLTIVISFEEEEACG